MPTYPEERKRALADILEGCNTVGWVIRELRFRSLDAASTFEPVSCSTQGGVPIVSFRQPLILR